MIRLVLESSEELEKYRSNTSNRIYFLKYWIHFFIFLRFLRNNQKMNGQGYVDEESLRLQIRRRSKDQITVHVEVKGPLRDQITQQPHQRFRVVVNMVNVREGRETSYCWSRSRDGPYETDLIKIKDGFPYHFECRIEDRNRRWSTVCKASAYYHAYQDREVDENVEIFTMSQMQVLKTAAVEFVNNEGENIHEAHTLFRNNPWQYFDNINRNKGGTMEVSPKNPNGDPRNPVSNRIKGIEFSVGNDFRMPKHSPFGDKRFIVDVNKLIDPERNRVYFSDFYCLGTKHRVTLVVTEPGSSADNYCGKKLRPLPMIPQDPERENPFFYYDRSQGCFFFTVSVWVEVFFTQNVELNVGTLVKKTFKRRRVGYGKPKKPDCKLCNLSLNIALECTRRNCPTCPKITTADSVKSTANRQLFPCVKNVTCQVENVVYLIECTYPGCGMQYVGETQHALGKRIAQHLNDIKQDRKYEAEKVQYLAGNGEIRVRKSLPEHGEQP